MPGDPGFLAFDLGASSGRAIFGSLTGERLALEEIHRFPNRMIQVDHHWHWDIHRFFDEIKQGLKACVAERRLHPISMAVNTWGVDFGLLSAQGKLLGLPFAYRDSRTDGMMEKFFTLVPRDEVYQRTGIQLMAFNSLFQLYSMVYHNSPLLKKARDLLFIPDLINYFLGGIKVTEFSFATTSQLYNPRQKGWDEILLAKMDISPGLLQEIVQPGTRIGSLKKEIADQTGAGEIALHSVVSHDTGSAVAAAPGKGRQWAYISSGTWSLLGVETDKPLISPLSRTLNFTNEGGVNSTFRLQKNITGLWILQQLRQSEAALTNLSYAEIMEQVLNAPPFAALIDPDEEVFNHPADMGEAMAAYCRHTGQTLPRDPFSRVRVFMESLALKYRFCLEQLARIYPHPIKHLHIIGGGSKNRLLNQFAANATGKLVFAGPGEATSIGNILVQALAGGRIKSIEAGRQLIRDSFPIETFEPKDLSLWDEAFNRFKEMIQRG